MDRLGNLLILPPGLNSEAGQKVFSDKKDIYRENFLRMMNDVLDYENWGPEQIVEREKILLDWAAKAFDDVPD